MREIKEITFDDIEAAVAIMKKLEPEDASQVSYMLCEWSYAVGFAKGVLAGKVEEENGK